LWSKIPLEFQRESYNFLMRPNPLSLRDLVTEWNRCHGAFYQLRESDLLWHAQEQNWLSYSLKAISGVPVLFAQATDEGVAAGVSGKSVWISLHGEIASGRETAFARAVDVLAPSLGKTRLYFGGEEFHLVSGIPDPENSRLLPELMTLGFNAADAADYAGSLSSSPVTAYIREAGAMAQAASLRLESAEDANTLDRLQDFLLQEFPGRWERELRFWRSRSDTTRAFWNVLVHTDGSIKGFSRLAIRGQGDGGWIPGALRFPLVPGVGSEFTDSCLGPIGIAKAERGKGTGRVLLGLSLELLFEKAAQQVCIDWTNAYNYYKPLAFPAVRNYMAAWKDY